jgi:hypothetical protein
MRGDRATAKTASATSDAHDEFDGLPPLPPPQKHKMGQQHRDYIGTRFCRANPDAHAILQAQRALRNGAQARGNNRFITCTCGWLVQLNATGRAFARKRKPKRRWWKHTTVIDRHNPRSACTNYECTKKLAHRKSRLIIWKKQLRFREDVIEGRAIVVDLTQDHPE